MDVVKTISTPSVSNWEKIKRIWIEIRLGLETVLLFVIIYELIPPILHKRLVDTGIGLIIVVGTIIISLIVVNSIQNRTFKEIYSTFNANLLEKENLIIKQNLNLSTIETQLMSAKKYAQYFPLGNKSFAILRTALRQDQESPNENELKAAIGEYCNNLHEIFGNLKEDGRECHVSIKIFGRSEQMNDVKEPSVGKLRILTKTFMRDGRGYGTRKEIDDQSHIKHFIEDNYDFMEIFTGKQSQYFGRAFHSNELLSIPDYKNSSLKYHNADGSPHFRFSHSSSMDEKIQNWPLAYRSCIVAAICPGVSKPNFDSGTFIGFLCVDYSKPDMFNNDDVNLITGYAEALYDTLDYFIKRYLIDKNGKKSKRTTE